MFAGKPVIGVVGGIGSGKSFISGLFGELGCLVIDSDQQIHQAYQDPLVQQTLRQWWGEEICTADAQIDRTAIARKVFSQPQERMRLERLLHPLIARQRQQMMAAKAGDAQVIAYVWDTPLLFETHLAAQCDAVVFVDCPLAQRLQRVASGRGWTSEELIQREKLQLPLDKKREMSEYTVENTADADCARSQVREVLSRILASVSKE